MGKRIVILASGSGSNAEAIIQYFEGHADIEIAMVLTNRRDAGVIERCARLRTPCMWFNRRAFRSETGVLALLKGLDVDLVVLAGFLWLVPPGWISIFPEAIVNIHPALLPDYGGKGMYGEHVHRAVSEAGEHRTGITVHYVNEAYDEGAVLFQAETAIEPGEDPSSIAAKVRRLEHEHYPRIIEEILRG